MDARFTVGSHRPEELDGCPRKYRSIHRLSGRRRSARWIEPVASSEQPGEGVDEDAHLRRQMPTVRKDRGDRELLGWVVPQQRHDGTGSKLLMDFKRRDERHPKAGYRGVTP